MKIKSIILNNELEFRNYLLNSIPIISQVYVYLDKLDNVIYFYIFTKKNIIIATKEVFNNKIDYNKIYQNLETKFNLNILINLENSKCLKKNINKL